MFNKNKIILGILILCVIGIFGYIGKGAYEYNQWLNIKEVVADGGYTNLYAGTFGAVITGCTYNVSGCSCSLCNDCGCNSYTQAMITMGQEVNNGETSLCVHESVQVKGTPIAASSGKQFMAGSLTGKCLMASSVLATPSMAASNFEKFLVFVDKYIIAGFSKK